MENTKCLSAQWILSGLFLPKELFIPSPKLFFQKDIKSLLPESQQNAIQG